MTTNRYNYYEILEVGSNAAQHEVTTAYERARTTYSGDNPAIYTIFSENEARELLTLIATGAPGLAMDWDAIEKLDSSATKYPLAAAKLRRMARALTINGFANFIE